MKVIYKKTVLERIRGAMAEAGRCGKEIEKIVLSVDEARTLARSLVLDYKMVEFDRWLRPWPYSLIPHGPQPELRVFGVRIEVEVP